jgi:hypothetical protein
MSYIISPEFHRNLWLRFSVFRLIAPVFVLGFIAFIGTAGHQQNLHTLRDSGLWVYFIAVIIWGNYEAGGALQDEIREKTWDFQRMSSITPGALGFGKLFGATSYAWYVGLLAMALFAAGAAQGEMTAHELARTLFCMVFAGVFGHGVAFLVSFADMAAGRAAGRVPRGKPAFLLGLAASYYVFTKTIAWVASPAGEKGEGIFGESASFHWFGADVGWENFVLASMTFFFFWTMTGISRVARTELMYRVTPLFWGAFALTFGLYVAGFASTAGDGWPLPAASNFSLAALGLSYCSMLPEAKDVRKYGRFARCAMQGDWRGAIENTPRWAVSAALAMLAWIVGVLAFLFVPGGFYSVPTLMTSVLLLALRDGCVVHALYLRPADRQAAFHVLFYYGFAYVLLPALHMTLVQNVLRLPSVGEVVSGNLGAGANPLFGWYYPTALDNPLDSILPPAVELIAAGWVLSRAVKRLSKNT